MKRIRRLLAQREQPAGALTPVITAAILAVTAMTAMAAWQSASPVPLTQKLTRQVEARPGAELVSPYRKWLNEDVSYIIDDQARLAFKDLSTDRDREEFIEQFWLRRDPTPGTVENEMKEEHYRRIAYANEHFASGIPGWNTDRGRIYIQWGPPEEIEAHPSGGETITFPFERWHYRFIDGIGEHVVVEFVERAMTGEYRMVLDPGEGGVAQCRAG